MDLHGQQKIMALQGVETRTPRQRTQVSLRWPFEPLVLSQNKCTRHHIY
jgi:hypothetical protein